jgi:hypothetical protein
VVADAGDGAVLHHAQQAHLDLGAELADPVEKNGAAVGQLERALAFVFGTGEGPTGVTER